MNVGNNEIESAVQLSHAVRSRASPDVLEEFLRRAPLAAKNTALLSGILENYPEAVQLSKFAGADPSGKLPKDVKFMDAFVTQTLQKKADIFFQVLFSHFIIENDVLERAVEIALSCKNYEFIKYLIDTKEDVWNLTVYVEKFPLLHMLILHKKVELASQLVSKASSYEEMVPIGMKDPFSVACELEMESLATEIHLKQQELLIKEGKLHPDHINQNLI